MTMISGIVPRLYDSCGLVIIKSAHLQHLLIVMVHLKVS